MGLLVGISILYCGIHQVFVIICKLPNINLHSFYIQCALILTFYHIIIYAQREMENGIQKPKRREEREGVCV